MRFYHIDVEFSINFTYITVHVELGKWLHNNWHEFQICPYYLGNTTGVVLLSGPKLKRKIYYRGTNPVGIIPGSRICVGHTKALEEYSVPR